MTQYLPPNLLALFAPRDPVPFLPPLDKLPHEKKLTPYNGVAQFLQEFEVRGGVRERSLIAWGGGDSDLGAL